VIIEEEDSYHPSFATRPARGRVWQPAAASTDASNAATRATSGLAEMKCRSPAWIGTFRRRGSTLPRASM
jgi:hypothetical protein